MSDFDDYLDNSDDDGEVEFFERIILEPRCRLPSILDDLNAVRERLGLDHEVAIGLPDESERADSFREGWVCIYEYPFKIGHSFPFNKLTADFVGLNPVPICQYMPSVWRLLRALELLLTKHEHLQLEARDLGHVYELTSDAPGRVTLVQRTGKAALVTHLSKANDRGWMQKYVFINKSTLGEFGSNFHEDWITDHSVLHLPESEHSSSRVQAILEIPESERSYSFLTKPHDSPTSPPTKRLRGPGSPNRESTRTTRAAVRPVPSKASSNTIPLVISDNETMSSGSQSTGGSAPSTSDVLRRLRNKQTGGLKPLSPAPIQMMPPSSAPASTLKRKDMAAPHPQPQQSQGSAIQLSFPSDFGVSKPNSPPMTPELKKLHFPAAQAFHKRFPTPVIVDEVTTYCFHAMQGVMSVKERYQAIETKLGKAEASINEKNKEIEGLRRTIADLKKVNADLGDKVAKDAKAADEVRKRNKELAIYARKKKEEVLDAAGYWVSTARCELFQQFKDGEASKWEVEKEMKEHEERTASMAIPGAEDDFPLPELE